MASSTPEVSIREAHAGDAERLAVICCQDAAHHAGLDPRLYTVPEPDEMVSILRGQITAPDPIILVAEVTAGAVGFVTISIAAAGERPGMLRPRTSAWPGIAVNDEQRGRGIGTRLMTAAEQTATARGADEMVLDCHAANAPAIRFYERLGYHTRGLILAKPRTRNGESS